MSRQQCFLKCILGTHAPIKLPHQEEVIVGRSKLTKIKDQACSRNQLRFKANCEDLFVEVKQLGVNPAGLDGFSLAKSGVYKLFHGSTIEILLNNFAHVIEFDPPPENVDRSSFNMSSLSSEKPSISSKRKLDQDTVSPRKNKVPKMDPVNLYQAGEVKETTVDSWENIDEGELYIFTSKGVKSSCKIAAFDMDGTLIKTKSGKVHPVDINDWQIAFPTIYQKLKNLIKDGFKILILSNQAPIGSGRVKINDFKIKIEAIVKKLEVPIQAYIATGKGFYRKPTTGMWKVLSEQKNDGLLIDMDKSFYCGDAAGRVAKWAPGMKKDHSMADKLFAENVGLKFYTPDEYFLGQTISNDKISLPEFIPSDLKSEPFNQNLISKNQEILVLVGYPGSGKSFLAKQIEQKSGHHYSAVCRDILGTWQKCAAKASELIKQGKSVTVDSTNPDKESRARWTSLAKELKVECRCAVMATTKAHARHNNKFRELRKIHHVPVNDIVFHTYKNKFVEPSVSEGFKEVITVNFNPDFEDEEAEKIYRMHLLEK